MSLEPKKTKPKVDAAGGFAALAYTLKKGKESGGLLRLYQRLRSKNACKTCALGMGGQKGGMINEIGHFPSVCKKSMQAQAGDMQGPIAESFFKKNSIAKLASCTPKELEHFGRLDFPVYAGPEDTHYRRLDWQEAYDIAIQAIRAAGPERFFLYVSGRSGNEAGFLAQLWVRAMGSANIHNCSYYCHQASGVGLKQVYGSGTASITLEDLEHTEVAVLIGANPASNHPRLITELMKLRRRGGKVIVINPIRELGLMRFRVPSDWRSMAFGSDICDLFIQPRIGTDIALLKGIVKSLIENDACDEGFLARHTNGWQAIREDAQAASWQELTAHCGVPQEAIEEAAKLLAKASRAIFMWAMGLTHHQHGVSNIHALCNVALARGFLGRPGCGMLPIRGHSNVQGMGSMGVTPALKEDFKKRLEAIYKVQIPEDPGMDTFASMKAAEAGKIDAAFFLGGNLFGSNPDAQWAEKALDEIGTIVQVSTKLNTGHARGRGKATLILPALTRDEEPQRTTQESMFNYVRISEGGEPYSQGEARSEVEILATLAAGLLPEGGYDWSRLKSTQDLREAIAQCVPGYGAIGDVGAVPGGGEEFQILGRTFHAPRFNTPDGRANMYLTPLPEPVVGRSSSASALCASGQPSLVLQTLRSEGQFNTVVYEEEDLYRGIPVRDAIMLSPQDCQDFGLGEGDRVVVHSMAGSMEASVFCIDIAQGSAAMYYPEANILVPQTIDPVSKTPAYKGVPVWLETLAKN